MSKKPFVPGLCLVALFLALPAAAVPITVQSVLFDADHDVMTAAPPVPQQPDGAPLQDGDFMIFRVDDAADPTVGNGIDDRTRAVFDFRNHSSYSAFSDVLAQVHGKIFGATLQLVLTAKNPYYFNDMISVENMAFVGVPQIGDQLEMDVTKIVSINLLDLFSQEQLENFLSFGSGDYANDGRIVLVYGDDAILSGAALTLTANDIPVPGTLALLLGLLPAFALGRRQRGDSR